MFKQIFWMEWDSALIVKLARILGLGLLVCFFISMFIFGEESATYVEGRIEKNFSESIKSISKPVVYENGILFTFEGRDTDDIYLSGSFYHWNKRVKLHKNRFGIHFAFIPIETPKGLYTYRFMVNGIWLNDPQQTLWVADGYGTEISAIDLRSALVSFKTSPKHLGGNRYQFFLKDKNYKTVSWVGSRNRWDPFVNPMSLKDGYWTLTLEMDPKQVFYLYRIDDENRLDPANPNRGNMGWKEEVNFIPMPGFAGLAKK